MTSSDRTFSTEHALRLRAEEVARDGAANTSDHAEDLSPNAMLKLIHELSVHQIELEMQNDELRRTQAERDTAETRYFDFYDLAPVSYFTVDMHGLILQANLTSASQLGVARHALSRHKLDHFVHPEDRDCFYMMRQTASTSGASQSCELRLLKANAEPFWVQVAASAALDHSHTSVLRLVVIDISERKRLEASLVQNEAKLKTILDGASDAIFINDRQGRFQYVNQQAVQMLGFSRDALLGMRVTDITPPEDSQLTQAMLAKLMTTGTMRYEPSLLRRDGSTLPVELNGALLADGNGFAACRDITERKQAEAARLANSKLRNAIIDSVPSQIAVLDCHGVIVAVNQGWRNAALDNSANPGKSANNTHVGINYLAICQSAQQRDSQQDATRVRDGILNVIAGNQPSFHHEYPCHSPTAQRWFSVSVTPLNLEDHGVVVTHTEITERKLLQAAQLTRAVEDGLAASRQQLREFVALNEATREEERKHIAREVHDELGQVLTALRMDLSLLGMRYGALDPALHNEVQAMKTLVDRAILGVRNVATHLRPVALDMGLVPAIEWLCQEFTRTNVLACKLDAQGSPELDELRAVVIFRIVQESLTNITRHARASAVNVTLGRRGHDLWLEVRDNGSGFDVDAARQKGSFGLLGMRERAIALGGCLEITSAPGHGTLVAVTIPFIVHSTGGEP